MGYPVWYLIVTGFKYKNKGELYMEKNTYVSMVEIKGEVYGNTKEELWDNIQRAMRKAVLYGDFDEIILKRGTDLQEDDIIAE